MGAFREGDFAVQDESPRGEFDDACTAGEVGRLRSAGGQQDEGQGGRMRVGQSAPHGPPHDQATSMVTGGKARAPMWMRSSCRPGPIDSGSAKLIS